jgi:GntR family transcriptional regulator, transcriptional repressor for pyruvate dehydrogenase complex
MTTSIYIPKVAELVATELRHRIMTGEIGDGEVLARESDLLEEFDVSRPSLREALRVLETEGLVRIRRGNAGGAVVRRPTAMSAAYHLSLTLQANHVTHLDLAAARLAIEPICASMAANLPNRHDISDELSELVTESEACVSTAEFTEAAHAFHRRLTELCGNTTMAVLAGTLEAVWSAQETRVLEQKLKPDGARERQNSIAAHRKLIAAIDIGKGAQASRIMKSHLAEMQARLTSEHGPKTIELTASPVADR